MEAMRSQIGKESLVYHTVSFTVLVLILVLNLTLYVTKFRQSRWEISEKIFLHKIFTFSRLLSHSSSGCT